MDCLLMNSKGKSIIKQDIKFLEYGIIGEKTIGFELKNSHMPMYILHDVYLEDGDFIRTMEFGRKKKKEGIYSPITQNQRHLELMKKIKIDSNKNILMKFMAGNYFEDFTKSVVVLANPKTVLNAKFAKKEVKEIPIGKK